MTFNKSEWFSKNKNQVYDENKVEKVNYHQHVYMILFNDCVRDILQHRIPKLKVDLLYL